MAAPSSHAAVRPVQEPSLLVDGLVEASNATTLIGAAGDRTAALLGGDTWALLLASQEGSLRVAVSSSDESSIRARFEGDPSCRDCYTNQRPAGGDPLPATPSDRLGTRSLTAFPLRYNRLVIGVFGVLVAGASSSSGPIPSEQMGQASVDMMTLLLLQHRLTRQSVIEVAQLRHALSSRVTIEQAKGIIAGRSGTDPETAFQVLRRAARSSNRSLADLANDVVLGASGRRCP